MEYFCMKLDQYNEYMISTVGTNGISTHNVSMHFQLFMV